MFHEYVPSKDAERTIAIPTEDPWRAILVFTRTAKDDFGAEVGEALGRDFKTMDAKSLRDVAIYVARATEEKGLDIYLGADTIGIYTRPARCDGSCCEGRLELTKTFIIERGADEEVVTQLLTRVDAQVAAMRAEGYPVSWDGLQK